MATMIPNPALNGQSRFGEIVIILSVFSVISTVAVAMRCYARLFMLRCFGRDDGVMVAAQVLALASAVAIGLEAQYGLGRHTWVVPQQNLIPYMKAFYASIVVYNIAVCLTKVSILLQYKRLFSNPIMQRLTLWGLCFLVAWAVALAFLLTLICQPVAAFWDPSIGGKCLEASTIWYIMAAVNIASDFAILTLPMPVIKSLQLPQRQKVMLIAVFCLGFFPCAVSIYRVKTLRTAIDTQDPMYDNVDAATWSFLELTTGVLAACLPTLRPIFLAAMPGLFGASGHRNRTGHSTHGNGQNTAKQYTSRHSASYGNGKQQFRIKELEFESRGGSSSGEEDLEFGGLKHPGRTQGKGGAVYSVSVVAAEEGRKSGGFAGGIKATTVVTQQVQVTKGVGRGYGRR
ncbi:hypothetical protein QBC34DRAFT_461346 [Podospora aff. communis PSN243]|uniref:Rhodopsin domain-containing protein n=1 Tax=Podospora aff. communis PSN243 TaxID=3040156 RepID=A0AAV9GU90_9PEZI|nr:hypothetical protein QBC34DRAFT_461346 [Podospora aff. communis PSN243]